MVMAVQERQAPKGSGSMQRAAALLLCPSCCPSWTALDPTSAHLLDLLVAEPERAQELDDWPDLVVNAQKPCLQGRVHGRMHQTPQLHTVHGRLLRH